MRYWIDTEFIERGPKYPLELISVGIVSEDDREFYAINSDFKEKHANDWVKANVVALLDSKTTHVTSPLEWRGTIIPNPIWKKHDEIASEFLAFIGKDDTPEFWGWCSAFDYVLISQLIGFGRWPYHWPHYFRDIQQVADQIGTDIHDIGATDNHHALGDAKRIRKLWSYLVPEIVEAVS